MGTLLARSLSCARRDELPQLAADGAGDAPARAAVARAHGLPLPILVSRPSLGPALHARVENSTAS